MEERLNSICLGCGHSVVEHELKDIHFVEKEGMFYWRMSCAVSKGTKVGFIKCECINYSWAEDASPTT